MRKLLWAGCLSVAWALAGWCAQDHGVLYSAVDDLAVVEKLQGEGARLIASGEAATGEALRGQLSRTRCELSLPSPRRSSMEGATLYQKRRGSVIVLGGLFKCGKCTQWHMELGAGFAVAEPDVFLTNYHVVAPTNVVAIAGMSVDGKVAAVQEVLAADKDADWALLRIPGLQLAPLPLRDLVEVGSEVTFVSHPNRHFYSFGKGSVARYGKKGPCGNPGCLVHKDHKVSTWWMEITADFGFGASGGPVFDQRGNVVGMISRVEGQGGEGGKPGNMVFKQCVPMEFVLKALRPAKSGE